MVLASMREEFKSPLGNCLYCFRTKGQFYHSVSPLYPNEANKPGNGQLHIFDFAEATTKELENRSRQGRMATIGRDAATR
jgi:hypothetical protein